MAFDRMSLVIFDLSIDTFLLHTSQKSHFLPSFLRDLAVGREEKYETPGLTQMRLGIGSFCS